MNTILAIAQILQGILLIWLGWEIFRLGSHW